MPRRLEIIHVYDKDKDQLNIQQIDGQSYLVGGELWSIGKMGQDEFGLYQEFSRTAKLLNPSDVHPQIQSALLELQTALSHYKVKSDLYYQSTTMLVELFHTFQELLAAMTDNDPSRIKAADLKIKEIHSQLPDIEQQIKDH